MPRPVDQNIDLIKSIQSGRKQIGNGQFFPQISGKIADITGLIRHITHFRTQSRFILVGKHDIGARIGQMPGNGQAHPIGSARDNGRFTGD